MYNYYDFFCTWYGRSLSDDTKEVIINDLKKFVFLTDEIHVRRTHEIRLYKKSDYEDFYLLVGTETLKFIDIVCKYLKHIKKYERLVRDNTGEEAAHELNLWEGFQYKYNNDYKKLDKIFEYFREVICRDNDRYFKWLMSWLANMVQKPFTPSNIVIVWAGIEDFKEPIFQFIVDEVLYNVTHHAFTSQSARRHAIGYFIGTDSEFNDLMSTFDVCSSVHINIKNFWACVKGMDLHIKYNNDRYAVFETNILVNKHKYKDIRLEVCNQTHIIMDIFISYFKDYKVNMDDLDVKNIPRQIVGTRGISYIS